MTVAEGSPGRALLLAEEEGLAIAGLVDEVLAALPGAEAGARLRGGGHAGARRDGVHQLHGPAARRHRRRGARRGARAGDEEQSRLVALRPLDAWGDVWHALTRLQDETERFNLDKRQAIVAGLGMLSGNYVMTKRYYVTTPIYYVNGAPHIGHAYTSIAADVMARWKRLDGFDVFFLTGTDEHGQKVEAAARDAGVDPQTFTDRISADFRDMTDKMGVSYDQWIRTTEERHKVSCAELWRRIAASGNIYLGHYEGWYAVRDEAFYDEDELTTRPDGSKVAPSGAPVEWVREPSYFFKLSAWQDRLLKLYEDEPDFILPAGRRNEVLSFVRGGLRDLSISRTSFTWGIPVPDAPGHVMYVWLDALNNYVTACGFPDETAPRWHYWPADAHFVGKDILRFHAVYWPAFLMAAGLPVPRRVTSNGWWTVDGEKMSKSLGNVIEPRQLAAAFGAGPGALLPAARKAVRRRRHAVAPGADHADQRRAGERPRATWRSARCR